VTRSYRRARPAARWPVLTGAAALAVTALGCASTWDEVTSRERDYREIFWLKPDPLETIRTTTDGERRGKALARLKEPLQNGGTAQDQDAYLKILSTAALQDREPMCRLGAIRALGEFKDPRAARTLEDVYQQPKLPFTQDFNVMIRQQALASLERMANEESRHLLIRVARQPGPAIDASFTDRQQTQDEKIIAIRALGRYKQPECADTLVYILETEKDVALRDRAHEALRESTGKDLPPDARAWRAALSGQTPAVAHEPSLIERVASWLPK
jgi:hypothetical protein